MTRRPKARHPQLITAAAAVAQPIVMDAVSAAFVVGANGELKIPRVEVVAYTGVPMTIRGFKKRVIIDLNGLFSTRASVPLLKDHNPSLIVGHTDRIENNGHTLKVYGPVSGSGPAAREVIENGKAGFPWQASVTAAVIALEDVPAGKRVMVNGRDWVGPLYIARETKLKEVSLLSMGADDQTSAAIAAANANIKESSMFKKWLKAQGWDLDTLSETQKRHLRAAYEAEHDAQAGDDDGEGESGSDADADLDAAIEGESNSGRKKAKKKKAKAKKKSAKRATVKAGGGSDDDEDDQDQDVEAGDDDGDEDEGDDQDQDVEAGDDDGDEDDESDPRSLSAGALDRLVDRRINQRVQREAAIRRRCASNPAVMEKAIRCGWSIQRAEAEMFRSGSAGPAVHAVGDRRAARNRAQVLEAALCRTAGLGEKFLEAQFDEQVLEASDHRSLRGLSIQGLHREVIRAANRHAPGHQFNDDTIRAGFEADRELLVRASGGTGFSTISLTGILGAVAYKSLLESFQAVESVAEQIARIGSVQNFHRHTRYRMSGKGGFMKVGKDGELKHHGLNEEEFGIKAHTAGEMLVLTREDQINDDLGALVSIAQIQGDDAFRYREELFFQVLLDNSDDFYSDDNGNLIEGTDTVLGLESLRVAEQAFMDQTDPDGKPIANMPKFILVGTALKTLADDIYKFANTSQFNDDGAKRVAGNSFVGRFPPKVSPYMNNGTIEGSSATKWLLFGDPRRHAAIEIAYLRGQRTPTFQRGEVSFNQLGMAWRSFWDIGCEKQDPRGVVMATGVAAE